MSFVCPDLLNWEFRLIVSWEVLFCRRLILGFHSQVDIDQTSATLIPSVEIFVGAVQVSDFSSFLTMKQRGFVPFSVLFSLD